MKKFFKFASYALLYVVITFASAFGIVFLTPPPSSGGSKDPGTTPNTIPAQFTQMLERISDANALDVDLQADIEAGRNKYIIGVDARVDLSQGFENISADGTITVKINDDQFAIDINYSEGNLFLDMFNGKFKIETDNIMDSVTQVLKILDIEIPDIGFDMSNFNPTELLGMLSDLNETKGENSITIKINVPMLGELRLECDLNYAISKVVLPKTSISSDTVISLNTQIDYPESVSLENVEEDEYINVSDLFLIAESTLNLVNQEKLGLALSLDYQGQTLNGFLSANLKEFDSKLTFYNILGYDLDLVAVDDMIYLSMGNINLKFDLKKSHLITNLLEEHFGISVPLDQITGILTAINDGSLFESIGELFPQGNKVDLSSIDLSIIESFKNKEGKYTFALRDIGQISCQVEEKELKNIRFSGFGIDAEVSVEEPKEIGITNSVEDYIDLEAVIPALNALFSTAKYSSFTGQISFNINDQLYNADYAMSVDDGNKVIKLATTLFGQQLKIVANTETIFIELSNLKLKAELNDIEKVIAFVEKNFPAQDGSEIIETVINQVKRLLNPEIHPDLITSMIDSENELIISIFGGSELIIKYNQTIQGITFTSSDGIRANISINANNSPIGGLDIEESEYLTVEKLLSIAQNAIDYLKAGQFYFDLYAKYEDIQVSAGINYDANGISFVADLSFGDIQASIKFAGTKIYVELGENNLMFDLDDSNVLFDFINENFGINVEEKLQPILGIMPLDISEGILNNLDLETIIRSIVLSQNANIFTVEILNGKIEIELENDFISVINASYEDITARIKVLGKAQEINLDKNYVNVSELLPYFDMLKNFISEKQFALFANAQVFENGQQIYATENARFEIDMNEKIKLYAGVKVTGRDTHSMEIFLHEDFLYANYNELLLKCNLNDMGEIIAIVMNMLGIDPSVLPFLKDIAGSLEDLNISSIKLPSMSANQIAGILSMFNEIEIRNNTLIIRMQMFDKEGIISLETDGNKIIGLDLQNIAVSNEQVFNLYIDFTQFNGVETHDESKNWVDISGSNELIKAILNMSEMRDFEVSGTFNVDMIITKIDVPFDFKIKIVDGKLEMMGVVGPMPAKKVIVNINQDAPNGYNGNDRLIKLYFKDNYFYVHRSETGSKGTYEKMLKIHYSELLSDPMTYLQYMVGLDDWIMDLINERLEKSKNRETPMDVSKIIQKYEVSESRDSFLIKLDLAEISNNRDLDYIQIGIKTRNDEETNNKNVIGSATFAMNVPFTKKLGLNMTSNDIILDNIGKSIDMSSMYEFIASYPYGENEQWIITNGEPAKAAVKQYTITFNENGGTDVADITAEAGAAIVLPYMESYYVNDIEGMTRTTYAFAGWYKDEEFTKPFTGDTMPRFGATLYAKWEIEKVEALYTLTFDTTGGYETAVGNAMLTAYLTASEVYTLPDATWTFKLERDADDNGFNWGKAAVDWTVRRYNFVGWYADADFTTPIDSSITINEDTVIYAKWNQTVKTEYWALGQKPNGK